MASNKENKFYSELKRLKIPYTVGSIRLEKDIKNEKDSEWEKYIVERQILRLDQENDKYIVYGIGEGGKSNLIGTIDIDTRFTKSGAKVGFIPDISYKTLANHSTKLESRQRCILLMNEPSPELIKAFNLKKRASKSINSCLLVVELLGILGIAVALYFLIF